MSGFPLYDNLINDLPKKDLNVKQKETFIELVNKMNKSGHELVYALIQVHYEQDETAKENIVPYGGLKENETFSWIFTKLPRDLRHILYRFAAIHIEKQREENERVNQSFS